MARAAKTEILTVRIQPRLLDAVRRRARSVGRSVSSEVVQVLQGEFLEGKPRRAIEPIAGWLSEEAPPANAREFRTARDRASARLTAAVRARARRS